MTLFPDTNIFVHYSPIENWSFAVELPVAITICLSTINELDKVKYSASSNAAKRRVQAIVKKFGKTGPLVFNKILFEFYIPPDLTSISAAQLLDKDDNDDILIASVISYQQNHPGKKVSIVSADLGMQLKCKTRDIQVIIPDEKYLIEEDDAAQKEIKKLATELNHLKNLQPKLNLSFDNGKSFIHFDMHEPWKTMEDEIQQEMLLIKEKHPLEKPDEKKENQSLLNFSFYPKTPEKVDKYNAAMETFYWDYEIYLRQRMDFDYKQKLTLVLNIELCNEGTTPAKDGHIYLHFPNGFTLVEEKDYYGKGIEPRPPDPASFEMAPYDLSHLLGANYFPNLPDINFGGFSIEETNSYDVNDQFTTINHHFCRPIRPLYVLFDTFEAAQSFEISYEVTAANIADKLTGTLSVVLNKILDVIEEG